MVSYKNELDEQGFSIIDTLHQPCEIESIIEVLNTANIKSEEIKQSEALYSIRNLLNNIPSLKEILFSEGFKNLVSSFGKGYSVVKSIYFDKPPLSNWFVPNHQDLTINVKERNDSEGFFNWVKKEGFYSVQPPIAFLENIITVRIHLDDTDKNNGALIVKPKSHKNGVVRVENQYSNTGDYTCSLRSGGVMLMKPLLFHKSLKTTNDKRRRVIHLELSNRALPFGISWAEQFEI